jgi:DNA-binding transcriptional ArsR family regulator
MRTSAPDLLPIFRSRLQGEILAALLLGDEERSISDLARQLGAPIPTVQREVARLEKAGILAGRRVGPTRLLRADRSSPVAEPLTELVLRTFGPRVILERVLRDVAGVERVEIFGSWAARYAGKPGPPPGDIDVLVVGAPDRDDVFDAASQAERLLARQVNTVIVSPERWADASEAFLADIRTRPRVVVVGSDESDEVAV